MAKRITKAEVIIAAAKERMDQALQIRKNLEVEVEKAQLTYEAYADSYDELRRALAPRPRGKSSPAPSVVKKSSPKKGLRTVSDPSLLGDSLSSGDVAGSSKAESSAA